MHNDPKETKNVWQPVKELYESTNDIRSGCIHSWVYPEYPVNGNYDERCGWKSEKCYARVGYW